MKTSTVPRMKAAAFAEKDESPLRHLDHAAFQSYLLQGVSRTFALTIPLLPSVLEYAVGNAYLLCRIIDTIEDEPNLTYDQKEAYCEFFVEVVKGRKDALDFARQLLPLLSDATKAKEFELIQHTSRVVRITHDLPQAPRAAIERCIRIMSEGMIYFQRNQSREGLPTLEDLNHYCYVVAGVVGEMLTDLFCHYSKATAKQHQQLMALATSFGQGLQMTNILKDAWDDRERGACWLPRDLFAKFGFDLSNMEEAPRSPQFEKGLERLIGITHAHLNNAFRYTLHIANRDKGIRRFCLLALGLAVLTIRNINQKRDYQSGEEVKISRKNVKQVYAVTRMAASIDPVLKLLYNYKRRGLPLYTIEGN